MIHIVIYKGDVPFRHQKKKCKALCFKGVYGFVLNNICSYPGYIQLMGKRLSPSRLYYKSCQADPKICMEMQEKEYPKGSGKGELSWEAGLNFLMDSGSLSLTL